jgi:hypothetical protein
MLHTGKKQFNQVFITGRKPMGREGIPPWIIGFSSLNLYAFNGHIIISGVCPVLKASPIRGKNTQNIFYFHLRIK